MRIAFFNYLPLEHGGGLARFFTDVSLGLTKRFKDVEITIVTFDKGTSEKFLKLYSIYFLQPQKTTTALSSAGSIKKNLQNISYIQCNGLANLKKTLKEFDLIYSKNDFLEVLLLTVFIGKKALPPVIFGFHTPVHYEKIFSFQSLLHNLLYQSPLYLWGIGSAKGFHVLNIFDKNFLQKQFPKMPVYHIPNPFNFVQFKEKIRSVRKKDKNIHLLWVGRLTKEKGIDDFLWIIKQIHQLGYQKKIIVEIAGTGRYQNEVQRVAKLYRNIIYHGQVDQKSIAKLYARNDIFISTSKLECFPYTFLEAPSMGLSIISYDIHGCSDIIDQQKNGILVSTKEEMVKKIIESTQCTWPTKNKISSYIKKKYNTQSLYLQLHHMLKRIYEQSLQ